jgi:hypothetical protein
MWIKARKDRRTTRKPRRPAHADRRLWRHLAYGAIVGIVSHGDFTGLEGARLDDETGFREIF